MQCRNCFKQMRKGGLGNKIIYACDNMKCKDFGKVTLSDFNYF